MIAVIGLGYIGLPTALLLAKAGNKVTGIDIDPAKVKTLNQGKLPFQENGLEELFEAAKQNFRATTKPELEQADTIIICVPTPMKDKKMDSTPLEAAIETIKKHAKGKKLVIIESTVTPGTTKKLAQQLDHWLAYCPERAIPGNTLHEMIYNDRTIGGTPESAEKARAIYSTFVKGEISLTDSTAAEMAKVAENTYRDVNIALANELALIAEEAGTNIHEVIKLANKHPRVNLHQPGIGVGGHCLPIDPWFLVEVYPNAKLIPLSRKINSHMTKRIVELLTTAHVKRVTVLGIAYKPDVDDTRESPGKELKKQLEKKGITVKVYDPLVNPEQKLEESLEHAQAIVLATAHSAFKNLDWREIAGKLEEPKLIIDGRNMIEPPANARYYGIGRGDLK